MRLFKLSPQLISWTLEGDSWALGCLAEPGNSLLLTCPAGANSGEGIAVRSGVSPCRGSSQTDCTILGD